MVSILACHAGDLGSIPSNGNFNVSLVVLTYVFKGRCSGTVVSISTCDSSYYVPEVVVVQG